MKGIDFYYHKSLLQKGKNKIYVWNGCGYSLKTITTNKIEMTIEELAYIVIKSGKGYFVTENQARKEAINYLKYSNKNIFEEDIYEYVEEQYYNNECYCYCDLSQFGLKNGYLLIENLKTKGIEVHS